jgi:hypothetical protein
VAAQTGFRVTRLFHPTAMVADLLEVEDLYRRLFAVRSLTIPYSQAGRAYRTLTVLADTCIENISPEQTHLSQFRMYLDIVGNHWYFPCFYVEDMQAAVYELHQRHRIRMTASGTGEPVIGLPPGGTSRSLLYTHPADTGIMWEFWEGDEEWFRTNPLADPRMRPGWKYQAPAADDPVAVEKLSHHTVVVTDPALALKFLVTVCKGRIFATADNDALGTRSTWVSVSDEPTVFEIAVPLRDGPCRKDLEKVGNTVHAVTFKVRDLARAVAHLKKSDVVFEVETPELAVTDPKTSCGLRFGFIEAFHPQDPRRP